MHNTVTFGVRIDKELKNDFYKKCNSLGLKPGDVTRLLISNYCENNTHIINHKDLVEMTTKSIIVGIKDKLEELSISEKRK